MPKVLQISFKMTAAELMRLEKSEKSAVVRVRLALIRLTLKIPTTVAAKALNVCASQACLWVKRFNAEGPAGLRDKSRRSRPSCLKPELVDAFQARVRAGALKNDGVNVLRGKDFQRILRQEFQAHCSLGGAYFILHRLGFANLSPRAQHPASDPVAQEEFKKTFHST